jgi:hypothetical protein
VGHIGGAPPEPPWPLDELDVVAPVVDAVVEPVAVVEECDEVVPAPPEEEVELVSSTCPPPEHATAAEIAVAVRAAASEARDSVEAEGATKMRDEKRDIIVRS